MQQKGLWCCQRQALVSSTARLRLDRAGVPLYLSSRQSRPRPNRRRVALCQALFKFGKSDQKQGTQYASNNGRDDYKEGDVEDYFNYMGMLAAEGNYDRLDKMFQSALSQASCKPDPAGNPPVDLLLLMAASESDAPKVAELLRAGADLDAKDYEGKTATQLTDSQEVLDLLGDRQKAFTF